jgi:hypothetical protein
MSAIKTAVRGYLSLSSVEQSQIRTELGFDGKYEWEHTTQETDVAFMRWIKDGNLSSDFIRSKHIEDYMYAVNEKK